MAYTNMGDGRQNYLYVYDLPKDIATSTALATYLKDKTGIVLSSTPQIRRDMNRPFYSAIIAIPEDEKFQQACKELRYFELADGKPSRALPYDNDLLGTNTLKVVDNNLFVRKIPKEMKPADLEAHWSNYGDIKSLKIALNPDHTSRGYGFVCFQDPASALKALEENDQSEMCQAIKYQPRDKRDFRRIYNNIYAKNFPPGYTEEQAFALFRKFGTIKSLVYKENPGKGHFAFICYEAEDKSDREYGPKCADMAVQELNNAEEIDGIALEKRFYVKEALPATEREAERKRETIKYKNSKKRCNLYVKGFPEEATEEDLRKLFEPFGDVESVRLHPVGEKVKKHSAFICFRKPDEASSAKEKLHGSQVESGRTLVINHYEIKEIRQLQNEAIKDKHDFQAFRQQNTQGATWTGLANQEDLQYYLKLLIENLPSVVAKQQRGQMGPQGGQRGNYYGNKQGFAGGGDRQRPKGQYQNRMPQGNMGQPQPQGYGGGQVMQPQPQMIMNPQPQPMQPQQQPPQQLTVDQRYLMTTQQILPAIVVENPNYKTQVGTVIYEFVNKIVGGEKAPKITGMLIDLPINDIQLIMQNYELFKTRVSQASELLQAQSGQ